MRLGWSRRRRARRGSRRRASAAGYPTKRLSGLKGYALRSLVSSAASTEECVEIAEIVARMEIHDVLMRQLRAMDRHDWDAVHDCFHPGARLNLPHSDGSVADFVARERDTIYPDFLVSMHFAGNELIEVDGDTA